MRATKPLDIKKLVQDCGATDFGLGDLPVGSPRSRAAARARIGLLNAASAAEHEFLTICEWQYAALVGIVAGSTRYLC